jgi:hypothetical protein
MISLGDLLTREPNIGSDSAIAELVERAVSRVYLYAVRRGRTIQILEDRRRENLARAAAFLRDHSNHPWERPFGQSRQLGLVREEEQLPTAETFVSPHGYWGHGVFRPRRGGFYTTTAILGWPSPFARSERPSKRWRMSELEIRAGARVLEIRRPQDWLRLTTSYPALVEDEPRVETPEVTLPAPLYLPDWPSVAVDWDGVRFTMSGKLRTLFNPLGLLDGFTILHADQSEEETLWLNWVLNPL